MILALLFILAIVLETTIIRFPFVMILLLVLFVQKKTVNIFALAFFLGLLLDILLLNRLGLTSLFYIVILFLVYLYERKYEINTLPFVLLSAGFACFVNTLLFNGNVIVFQILGGMLMSGILFTLAKYIQLY